MLLFISKQTISSIFKIENDCCVWEFIDFKGNVCEIATDTSCL